MCTSDQTLRFAKEHRVYFDEVDYGGMFPGVLAVFRDPVETCSKPYLAIVTSGFNRGRGKRHGTELEAMRDLERLSEAEFGY